MNEGVVLSADGMGVWKSKLGAAFEYAGLVEPAQV